MGSCFRPAVATTICLLRMVDCKDQACFKVVGEEVDADNLGQLESEIGCEQGGGGDCSYANGSLESFFLGNAVLKPERK
ncbi:hypothetical protein SDJN03_09679, partial [Cucurbita argyrosperma subsp. sororia]